MVERLFYIAFSLLGGWILSLFGFDDIVIKGMNEVFGVNITLPGYYFLFALFGALKQVFSFMGLSGRYNLKKKDDEE